MLTVQTMAYPSNDIINHKRNKLITQIMTQFTRDIEVL